MYYHLIPIIIIDPILFEYKVDPFNNLILNPLRQFYIKYIP